VSNGDGFLAGLKSPMGDGGDRESFFVSIRGDRNEDVSCFPIENSLLPSSLG
jgi:hypothetical protein